MIDGGPLRTSRPTGRQVEFQDEPVRYQPEEPQRVEPVVHAEQPRRSSQYRQPEPQRLERVEPVAAAPKAPRNYSWVKWPIIAVLLLALGFAAWRFWPMPSSVEATIDSDKYQAVFLSNGQVYFGKLAVVNNDYMELTNVYYLERQLTTDTDPTGEQPATEEEATTTPTGENNFQLLKYSDVLYGSEDAMVISKDDIIRFENLRTDGVVAKAIANRS